MHLHTASNGFPSSNSRVAMVTCIWCVRKRIESIYMEDATCRSTFVPTAWRKEVHLDEKSTETEGISKQESSCDPMEMPSCGTQTDQLAVPDDAKANRIEEETLVLMEHMMEDSVRNSTLLDRLNVFHSRSSVRLQSVRTKHVPILSSETLAVTSMCSGSGGRIAILIGEPFHDTWCAHLGKVVVSHRSKVFSLPQAVCPSCAAWSPRGVLAVGTWSGQITLYSGETLLSENSLHEGPVSCVEWIGSSQVITCSGDGNIVLSTLKGTTLEPEKTIRLSVSDLPRLIRKNASSSKPLAIVGLSRLNGDLCLCSETGGIWIVSLPDLMIKTIPSEPRATQQVQLLPNHIAIAGDSTSVRVLGLDGSHVDTLSLTTNARWLLRSGNILLAIDDEFISVFDCDEHQALAKEKINIQAAAVSEHDEITILTRDHNLIQYQIAKV